MKYALTITIVLVALLVGAVLFAWSGIYNIAATRSHWGVTLSFIETLRDRSISVRSDDIRTPNMDNQKLKEAAFSHYHEMCRLCHGAPGYPPEEFSEGLYPAPPKMTSGHIQEELTNAEIYWIVKHGIKMTGMPAFGPTHDQEQLWGLTALAKEMSRMTAEKYRRQIEEAGHGHEHEQTATDEAQDHGYDESSTHSETEKEHH